MASLLCSPQISSTPKLNTNPKGSFGTTKIAASKFSLGFKGSLDRKKYTDEKDVVSLLLSASPVKEKKGRDHEDSDKQKYYVNSGYAIRTIRDEFPRVFDDIEMRFDIYRDDIVYRDPYNTFTGIENYKSIFSTLRFYGRIFFKALWIDIISVSQPLERGVIMVRWTVHGIPRVLWECHGRFDGTSEYKLDKEGKIYEHKVDNVVFNSPKKFRVLSVDELIQSLGVPSSTAKPTYFESSLSSILKSMLLLEKLTRIRQHLVH